MFERQYWNLSFEVRGDRRRQHRVRRRRARRRRPALLLLSGAAEAAAALEILVERFDIEAFSDFSAK